MSHKYDNKNKSVDEIRGSSKAQRIILAELEKVKRGRKYKLHGNNLEIQCPFHGGGRENTPSCGIYLGTGNAEVSLGTTYCLGCGWKGSWNMLADKLKLKKVDSKEFKRDSSYVDRSELTKSIDALLGDDLDTMDKYLEEWGYHLNMDFNQPEWRTISGHLCRDLGARLVVDLSGNNRNRPPEPMLIFPINVKGKTTTIFKARIEKKEGELSYINFDASNIKKKGLFPFDHVRKLIKKKGYKWIVLVEGQRDALRLIQYGIPALAILGSKNWSKDKAELVAGLGMSVVVCMDGDTAGISATNAVVRDFDRMHLEYKVIELMEWSEEEGRSVDPGNAPKELIEMLMDVNKATRPKDGKYKRLAQYSKKANSTLGHTITQAHDNR